MIEERKIMTTDKYNENGNPFPQYEKYVSYLTKTQTTTGLLKIFDSPVQLDTSLPAEQDRTLSFLSFTCLIDSGATDSFYQEKVLLDVKLRVKSSTDDLARAINLYPINTRSGNQFYAILAYQKTSDTPTKTYQVQIYVYIPNTLTQIRFTFLDFYTEGQPNRYAINGDNSNNFYTARDRIAQYLGNNIINNTVVAAIPGGYSSESTQNKPNYSMTHSTGNSFTIAPETNVIKLGASTDVSLDTIPISPNVGNLIGKKIELWFYNGHTSVVSTGAFDGAETNQMYLKGGATLTGASIVKGNILTLEYNGTKWVEVSRNF